MWQLGPGSPVFFMGFSRKMKKTMLLHMVMGCGFIYILYRLGFFQPVRRLFASTPNRWDILQRFPEARGDAVEVTWYHRANSRETLKEAIKGPHMMIESDILIDAKGSAIMAHPPATSSDLTFDVWLHSLKNVKKGLKLDFKTIEIVPQCLKALAEAEDDIEGAVVINADILKGPYGRHNGLHANKFVQLFKRHYPHGLLSIGWVTDDGLRGYTWLHVYQMFQVIEEQRLLGVSKITFPIRASLMHPNAVKKLHWLLDMVPDSSLTVFAGAGDKRKAVDDLLLLRYLFPEYALFLDIEKSYSAEALKTFHTGRRHAPHLKRKFADFMVDMSNLKTDWNVMGAPAEPHYLTTYSFMSGGAAAALVSGVERTSTFLEQTNFRTFFFPFSKNDKPVGSCSLEIVLRNTDQLTNELVTPLGVVCRLELPSGRMAIQASADRDAAIVEERLELEGVVTPRMAYRLSVQDDGHRVAFVVTVLDNYDEAEMSMRTSKRLVLATKLNSDVFFHPAIITRCADPNTLFVLHDLKV